MIPSVKIALLVSMGCIGTVSWVVTHISRGSTQLVLQLVPELGVVGGRVAGVTVRRDRPAFAHENVLEREARLSPSKSVRLARSVSGDSAPARRYIPQIPRMRSLGRGTRPPAAGGEVVVRLVRHKPDRGSRLSGRMLAAITPASARRDVEPVARVRPRRTTPAGDSRIADTAIRPAGQYVVCSGDTLVGIARRLYGSDDATHVAALVRANSHLKTNPNRILAGQALVIPARGAFAEGGAAAADEAGGKTKPPRVYTIRKGDSLISIARRLLNNGSRWREIVKLNRSLRVDRPIHAGVRIRVPEA